MKSNSKQLNKFKELYNFISNNIYYSRNDFDLTNKSYNSALLLGLSSAVLNGKLLYVGEYGLGKTTLSETISSLIYLLPRKIYNSSSIKGNPEIANDQVIGRPNLGELNQGKEKVIWSEFVLSRPKIVDEINRIPSNKQNLLLTGMQTDRWSYLNSTLEVEDCPWFATRNYSDAGNTGIIPPLLDRFELAVESKSPGLNNFRSMRYHKSISLDSKDLEDAYYDLLSRQHLTKKEFNEELGQIKRAYKSITESKTGLELFTERDLNQINEEVKSIEFDQDSNFLFDVIISELGSCQLFGQKRTNQDCPTDCHFSNYACNVVQNDFSTRTVLTIDKYSKMLAWIEGKKRVEKTHLKRIAPFALWHKIKVKEEYLQEISEQKREDALEVEATKKIIDEIEKRQHKLIPKQKEVVQNIISENVQRAIDVSKRMDHPVFKEYLK